MDGLDDISDGELVPLVALPGRSECYVRIETAHLGIRAGAGTMIAAASPGRRTLAQRTEPMDEPAAGYPFLELYWWLRAKIESLAPIVEGGKLDRVAGRTRQHRLPDFRLNWSGVRLVGLFPRPNCVQLLLEYDKFLAHREAHDADVIARFEDAAGAIIINRNRLLSLRSADEVEERYLDTYLELGMRLLLAELMRRHA